MTKVRAVSSSNTNKNVQKKVYYTCLIMEDPIKVNVWKFLMNFYEEIGNFDLLENAIYKTKYIQIIKREIRKNLVKLEYSIVLSNLPSSLLASIDIAQPIIYD